MIMIRHLSISALRGVTKGRYRNLGREKDYLEDVDPLVLFEWGRAGRIPRTRFPKPVPRPVVAGDVWAEIYRLFAWEVVKSIN